MRGGLPHPKLGQVFSLLGQDTILSYEFVRSIRKLSIICSTKENPVKRLRPQIVAATVLMTLLATAATPIRTLAEKPALIVSVSSVDGVLSSIDHLTGTAGAAQVGLLARVLATPYLEGLDQRRPVGVLISIAGEPSGLGFVPVADFEKVLAKLEEIAGAPEDVGGGVKELELPQRSIFFKEQNGWAFISDKAAALGEIPENPAQLLDGLNEKYQIAVRVNVPSIPEPVRQMAIGEMKKGFQQSVNSEADDEQRQLQERLGGQSLDSLIRFVEEADQVTIGLGVDQDSGYTFLDFNVTALPGTTLAEQMAAVASVKSDFTGFLMPDAAATLHFSSPVTEEDKAQTLMMLKVARKKAIEEIGNDDDLPSDEAREKAKHVANSLIDVFEETINSGLLAGGASLLLDGTDVKFVAGGYVADGSAVERNLRELVELTKKTDDAPEVVFNAAKHGDVNLHTVALPVPEDEDEARKVFGDELLVVVGTGPKSVYLALGDGGMDLIKNVIDSSAGNSLDAPPMIFNVALGPILEFASNFEDDPQLAALADALGNAQGKDHVSIRATPIDRGMSYRIGIEAGVLQLIGAATAAQNR